MSGIRLAELHACLKSDWPVVQTLPPRNAKTCCQPPLTYPRGIEYAAYASVPGNMLGSHITAASGRVCLMNGSDRGQTTTALGVLSKKSTESRRYHAENHLWLAESSTKRSQCARFQGGVVRVSACTLALRMTHQSKRSRSGRPIEGSALAAQLARESKCRSAPRRAISWVPSGSVSSLSPVGSEIAGVPSSVAMS